MVNLRSPGQRQATLSVPFSIGCSDVCRSDLSVSASLAGGTGSSFVIGASDKLELLVNVSNAGEPASLPRVQVSLGRITGLCHRSAVSGGTLEALKDVFTTSLPSKFLLLLVPLPMTKLLISRIKSL